MGFVLGKVYPGLKTKTGAFMAAAKCIVISVILIIEAVISLVMGVYREDPTSNTRTVAQQKILGAYYGVGFIVYGTWAFFTTILIAGITVVQVRSPEIYDAIPEHLAGWIFLLLKNTYTFYCSIWPTENENKRALGFWLIYTAIYPVYFVAGIIFVLSIKVYNTWEIVYLVMQGILLLFLMWACLAVWVYLGEVRARDKNPELRIDEFVKRKENEVLFAQPFMQSMPIGGAMNPGWNPGQGSIGSVARSHKSRMTYAPTETESVKTAPSVQRQSRRDQYVSHHSDQAKKQSEKSPEREGGTTYYRYQYNGSTDQPSPRPAPRDSPDARRDSPAMSHGESTNGRNGESYQPSSQYQPRAAHHGSQGSIGRVSNTQAPPAQLYQPASYQPRAGSRSGSQGSLSRVGQPEPSQPRYQQSGYQPASYQPSAYKPRNYQGSHHGSQSSIGRVGHQPAQHPPATDSEV